MNNIFFFLYWKSLGELAVIFPNDSRQSPRELYLYMNAIASEREREKVEREERKEGVREMGERKRQLSSLIHKSINVIVGLARPGRWYCREANVKKLLCH